VQPAALTRSAELADAEVLPDIGCAFPGRAAQRHLLEEQRGHEGEESDRDHRHEHHVLAWA
jgi:hypothetical protein